MEQGKGLAESYLGGCSGNWSFDWTESREHKFLPYTVTVEERQKKRHLQFVLSWLPLWQAAVNRFRDFDTDLVLVSIIYFSCTHPII